MTTRDPEPTPTDPTADPTAADSIATDSTAADPGSTGPTPPGPTAADPTPPDPTTADDDAADDDAEPVPPTPPHPVVQFIVHIPFTIGFAAATIVLGLVLGPLRANLSTFDWAVEVAYGLPAIEAGRWLTIALGPFFALEPWIYIVSLVTFVLGFGLAEWRLGTVRAVAIAIGTHVAATLISIGLLAVARDLPWPWAQEIARQTDVGFSSGMVGALAVATATMIQPWRTRLRLALVAYGLFALVLLGGLADVEHLVALAITLPFARLLAGPRAITAPRGIARPEKRLIVAVGLLVIAAAQLLVHAVPDRATPFGVTEHTTWTLGWLLAALAVWLLIARGLLRGRRWAWWLAVVITLVPLAATALLFMLASAITDGEALAEAIGLPQLLAGALLYVAYLVVLLAMRDAYRKRDLAPLSASVEDPGLARTLLKRHGGSSISWMTTWPRIRHMVTADGESFVGFREHAGVVIALGDPVGPPDTMVDTVDEWVDRCEAADRIPFLFSVTRTAADVARARGWRVVQIAEDNLMDLPDLAFTGKKWQAVRTALNKAPKEGVSFRLGALADQPAEILDQVQRVSDEWLGEKALPEMGFTLGGVPEALDRDVAVGLAVDEQGRVHGITSWLPAYASGGTVEGWTLDVMRRIEFEGSFRPTMEFLIASSAMAFKEQGPSYMSLSGAPLARSTPVGDDGPMEKLLDLIGAQMEPLYGFRSLHQFKAKFQPRLDPMYMAFRDEADLPMIGIAITRAFLPDAGVGDFVGVARTALGGRGEG